MKTFVQLLLLFAPFAGFGQVEQATLLGHWHDASLIPAFFDNPYHDVWGTVVNDKEIGIISSTAGFHFFDLSDQSGSFEPKAFIPGTAQGEQISHRDFKTYQHYLYGVADEGLSALQIIDLSGLPESVEQVYQSSEFILTCHNIFIDEDNARLYAVGGSGFNLRILSLENPESPELLASFPNAQLDLPYIHDCYVRDNIAYLNAGFDGFWVVDLTDPANPEVLGTMTTYPQQGYNHSGWLSDDGNYFYLCDETHGSDIKVVDVSDFSDMEVVATMNAGSTPNQIPHNVILKDNLLYASYYYDGLQVFDVSNPLFPRRIAYYDTSDEPNISWFAGAWGVYVLPSGRSLISDMNNGMWFFNQIPVPPNTSITANSGSLETCAGIPTSFSLLVGTDFEPAGVSLSTVGTPAEVEVQLSTTTAAPGEIVEVTVNGTQSGIYDIVLNATDGTNEAQTTVTANFIGLPPPAFLLIPTDGKTNVALSPLLVWSAGSGALSKRVEISTDETDFENNIVFSSLVGGNSLVLAIDLEEGTTYFWRVVTTHACGDNPSPVFSFTTRVVTDVQEIAGNVFRLHPNPVEDVLYLSFEQPIDQALRIEWLSLNGQKLNAEKMENGAHSLLLPVSNYPEGLYLLRLSTHEASVTRKVMVQR